MRSILALTIVSLAGSVLPADEPAPPKKTEPTPAQLEAREQIRGFGGQVMEIAQNDSRLEVSYHLADGKIEDAHLAPVPACGPVIWLNLRGTAVTDAGLAHLAGAKSLVRLHLEKTPVTDAGLVHLKGLENLEYLNLYGTAVTDAGLDHLAGLPKLQKLYLWETPVTDAGVAKLQQARPELRVIRGVDLAQPQPAEGEPKPEEKAN